jgi:hypothetical protein
MKYFLLFVISLIASTVFAAGVTFTPSFHNLSSSTKSSAASGQIKYNATYLFVNISTAARPHWRRIALGGSF